MKRDFKALAALAVLALSGCSVGVDGVSGVGIGGGIGSGIGIGAGVSLPIGTAPNYQTCDGAEKLIHPAYPAKAQALKQGGKVTASFDVNDIGKPENIELTGDDVFFQDTKAAMRRSCWKQASARQMVTYTFTPGRLSEASPVAAAARQAGK